MLNRVSIPTGQRRVDLDVNRVMSELPFTSPPLGIIGQPEDIAAACTYLASDETKYVTGQVTSPNGESWS